MPFNAHGGCGCSSPAPIAKPRAGRSLSNVPLGCGAVEMVDEAPCYSRIPDGCTTSLTLTQGETLDGQMIICSGRPIGAVSCLLPPDKISFTTPNCLKVGNEFTIWCGSGCTEDLAKTVFEVTAISADGLVATVTPNLPGSVVKTCYTKGLAVLGCPSPITQSPPMVFLHRDLNAVEFIGAIWTHEGTTGSRTDYGLTVTEDPTIVSSFEVVLTEGDRVCIPRVGINTPAVVLRTWQGSGYCNGELVEVQYAKLSIAAKTTGQCGPAHIEHGSLLNFDFELLDTGCISVKLSSGQTASLPLRESDKTTHGYHVGRFQIFAIIPYLNKAGQLQIRTEVMRCGDVIVNPSFAGQYGTSC